MTEPLAAASPSTGSATTGAATTVGPCTQRRTVLAALPGIVLLPGILSACGMTEPAQPVSTVQATTSVPQSTIPAADVPVGTAKQVRSGMRPSSSRSPRRGSSSPSRPAAPTRAGPSRWSAT